MLDRLAIYGVPAAAGLVSAVVMLGPGAEQHVVGARTRGVLVEGSTRYALRLQTLAHYSKVFTSIPESNLQVELSDSSGVVANWSGDTDERGRAEVFGDLKRPLGKQVTIVVKQGEVLLGKGEAECGQPLALMHMNQPLAPPAQGDVPLSVVLPRGLAATPFPEKVSVAIKVSPDDVDPPPTLAVNSSGAEVGPTGVPIATPCKDGSCGFGWQFNVTPNVGIAQLSMTVATATGKRGSWSGEIPVVVGKMWLDPKGGKTLHVRAAIPKDEAFLSLLGPEGRLWGTRVTMATDELEFSAGDVELPELPLDGPITVRLANDGEETLDRSVSWPLNPNVGMTEPRGMVRVVDGMPPRIEAEVDRRNGVRFPGYGLILAAALFELLYLLRRGRVARAQLQQHIEDVNAEGPAEARVDGSKLSGGTPLLVAMLVAGGLAVAFAALAAVMALR